MTATTIDMEAAREAIGAKLAEAEATAARLDAAIGRLALAVTLDEAPESDLVGAREARAAATARAAELGGALEALAEREAAQVTAAAEAVRVADLAEREQLLELVKISGTEAALLIDQLAAAVRAAVTAEAAAIAIAKRHDLAPRGQTQAPAVGYDVAALLGERLHELVPGQAYQRAATAEAAAGRLLHLPEKVTA